MPNPIRQSFISLVPSDDIRSRSGTEIRLLSDATSYITPSETKTSDNLSESSTETEAMARQTLENLDEKVICY